MKKKITGQPAEITIYFFTRDRLLNEIDSGSMAFCSLLCAIFSVKAFEIIIPVVERGDEMRGCPSAFSAADETIFYQHDVFSLQRQIIRGCYSGNPSANDHNIG